MRIICNTIEDFVENLPDTKEGLYRGIVYASRIRRQIQSESHTGEPVTIFSFDVIYQVSAILQADDGSGILLEAGEHCGIDRETADGGTDGSDRMADLDAIVFLYCEQRDISLMPGIIDGK